MSDYLHIKEWRKFKRGELVRVNTHCLLPRIDGIFQLRRIHKTSNYPYRIWFDNTEYLLEKDEVYKIGELKAELSKPQADGDKGV